MVPFLFVNSKTFISSLMYIHWCACILSPSMMLFSLLSSLLLVSSPSSSLMHESVSILNDIVSHQFGSWKALKSNVSITVNQYNINSWKPPLRNESSVCMALHATSLFRFMCLPHIFQLISHPLSFQYHSTNAQETALIFYGVSNIVWVPIKI